MNAVAALATLAVFATCAAACGAGGDGGGADGDAASVDVADPTIDRDEIVCDVPCPPPPPIQCPQPSGDPGQPIELVPLRFDGQGALVEIVDGDHLLMERPFQGGRVVYVGVRARNIADGCNVTLNGAVRDAQSNFIMGLEERPTYLVVESDGWAAPVTPWTQTLANVPLCPNAAATRDLDGNNWQLELRLQDGARRTTVTRSVVLECGTPVPFGEPCECECDSDYVLGGVCPADPVDAGVD
jgi:hypothetical protein